MKPRTKVSVAPTKIREVELRAGRGRSSRPAAGGRPVERAQELEGAAREALAAAARHPAGVRDDRPGRPTPGADGCRQQARVLAEDHDVRAACREVGEDVRADEALDLAPEGRVGAHVPRLLGELDGEDARGAADGIERQDRRPAAGRPGRAQACGLGARGSAGADGPPPARASAGRRRRA
jgi:hypothetical protein